MKKEFHFVEISDGFSDLISGFGIVIEYTMYLIRLKPVSIEKST